MKTTFIFLNSTNPCVIQPIYFDTPDLFHTSMSKNKFVRIPNVFIPKKHCVFSKKLDPFKCLCEKQWIVLLGPESTPLARDILHIQNKMRYKGLLGLNYGTLSEIAIKTPTTYLHTLFTELSQFTDV